MLLWATQPHATNILGFLHTMSTDSSMRDDFIRDPHGVMDSQGLTEDEKKVVLSKDPSEVLKSIATYHPPK